MNTAVSGLGAVGGKSRAEQRARNRRHGDRSLAARQLLEAPVNRPVARAAKRYAMHVLQNDMPALLIDRMPVASVGQQGRGNRGILAVNASPQHLHVKQEVRVAFGTRNGAYSSHGKVPCRRRQNLKLKL